MSLSHAALGEAHGDARHAVREVGGNNAGPWIRTYLTNVDPPIHDSAPWCAAAVQYWFDMAAKLMGYANPLDAVKLEALVASYHQWATDTGRLVTPATLLPGDLICFNFNGQRWDHIGMISRPIGNGMIVTVEGNTSPGVGEAGDPESQRDGDGVFVKQRSLLKQPVAIIRVMA